MKKLILIILALGTLLSSCGSNGNEAKTEDAKKIEVKEASSIVSFTTIAAGSTIDWRAAHLGGVQPRFGKISVKTADFSIDGGNVANATIEMDMASVVVESFPVADPQIAKFTGHLLSPDFFDVAKFPTAKFELSGITAGEGEFNSMVTGNLTIKEATKSITFKANVTVSDASVSIKSEDFAINRLDWNLNYNVEGTPGVPTNYIIANDIGFTINVTATK